MLAWDVEDNVLTAPHPAYHDDGSGLYYRVEKSERWTATFEGYVIHMGPLDECLSACERDAELDP